MRLIANAAPGALIRRYSEQHVTVQLPASATAAACEQDYSSAILLQACGATPLAIQTPLALSAADCEPLWQANPELVILGHREPGLLLPAAERARFLSRGIGLEIMALGAACRTYNLLMSDGRPVAALLFPRASR